MKPKAIAEASDQIRLESNACSINKKSPIIKPLTFGGPKSTGDFNLRPAKTYGNSHSSAVKDQYLHDKIRNHPGKKPYSYSPGHNTDRDYRGNKAGGKSYTSRELWNYGYSIQRYKNVHSNWIGDLCWYHYTKGSSATDCIDREKCHGYKAFRTKC